MFGKVLRATGYNATLDSIDTTAAEKMPGVKLVRDGDFIGVVAPDAWTADEALASIQAKWTVPSQPSNKNIFDYLKTNSEAPRGGSRANAASPACHGRSPGTGRRHRTRPVLHRPVHRARTARTPRRCRPMGLDRQAHRLDRNPAPVRRQGRTRRRLPRRLPLKSASFSPTWAAATAASTPAKLPSKQHASPKALARPSNSSGPAKRSSPGPTSGPPASWSSKPPSNPTAPSSPGSITTTTPATLALKLRIA